MAVETDIFTISTVLSNVNSLYTNLVTYTVGLIVFVGAFVPGFISFLQSKQLNRETADLKKQMQIEIQAGIKESAASLADSLKEELQLEIEKLKIINLELKNDLMKEIKVVKGNTFHLQALHEQGNSYICVQSCLTAITWYLEAEEERNVRSIIAIAKDELEKIDSDQLKRHEEIEETIKNIIAKLNEYNVNGRYEHDVNAIKLNLKIAKQRTEKAEA